MSITVAIKDSLPSWYQPSVQEPVKLLLIMAFIVRHTLGALKPLVDIDPSPVYVRLGVLRVVLLPGLVAELAQMISESKPGYGLGMKAIDITVQMSRISSSTVSILMGCEKFGLPLPPQVKSVLFCISVTSFAVEVLGGYAKKGCEMANPKEEISPAPNKNSDRMEAVVQATGLVGSLILFGVIPVAAPVGSLLLVMASSASLYKSYKDKSAEVVASVSSNVNSEETLLGTKK